MLSDNVQTRQRAMEHSIGLKRNHKIMSNAESEPTSLRHLLRRPEKLSKIVTNWCSHDEETLRWYKLKLAAGPYGRRLAPALDRAHWRYLEEAYAKRHTELREFI